MRVHVEYQGTKDLQSDLTKIPAQFVREGSKAVRKNVDEGNRITSNIARASAGKHGKLYPRSFTSEMTGALSGVYGPDASMPQGGMSFNAGSRNQPPHLDMEKGLDLIRPKFARDVDRMLDGLFWPES